MNDLHFACDCVVSLAFRKYLQASTMNPRIKLTYFDFDGGRGEPARLALAIAAINFEDHRIPLKDWPSVKTSMPFHAVPVLDVDGRKLTQSNTINRYLGRLCGLYPSDPWEAAQCDEVLDAFEDITAQLVTTIPLNDAEKKAARERLSAGPIPLYMTRINYLLE